ncbi:MAG: ADP-ribosylglycohydrolase family protein, partial [Planctomycetota bacterium]
EEGGPDGLKRAGALCDALGQLQPVPGFPYEEPDELEAIRACRPPGPRHIAAPPSPEALEEQTLGAWLGRAAGCMLGKPVEGWRREKIDDLLAVCGLDELADYFPMPPEGAGAFDFHPSFAACIRGNIDRAARDDDMDYTVVGLRILEDHGRDFTPRQVAEFWLSHLPYHLTYTAERAAYRNFVNGIWPPASSRHRNPYREWIGAQIRADAFGYACPGRPEEAAGLAHGDASISHVKNGIYGEMWVAAMLAAAFATDRMGKVIEIGLSEVPANCRLAEAVGQVRAWHREGIGADGAIGRILAQYGSYHGVHTINNAAIVAMALLWGEQDFSRTVGLAVRAGLDTDCNGATAGSVLGAAIGASAIPDHWTAPLNDRLETIVAGESELTLSGLAARTRRMQQRT